MMEYLNIEEKNEIIGLGIRIIDNYFINDT